ncbi:Uncharacterised protein [Mycobacteroides abscessus subsp. abscessus]|nr:Uncharacterised protein [Mycobacteroides abscessus subsp. abscessus]
MKCNAVIPAGAMQFAGQDIGFDHRKARSFACEQRDGGSRITEQRDAAV